MDQGHPQRPIVFLDLETTGINPREDRIIEIALIKVIEKPVLVSGNSVLDNFREWEPERKAFSIVDQFESLVDPETNIPEVVTEITGIKNEDVKNKPTFREIAKKVVDFMGGCDLAGYNSNRFDIPCLIYEINRVGTIEFDISGINLLDVGNVFKRKEQRTLSAAVEFYCNKVLEGAHGAKNDTQATFEVFKQMLIRYDLKELTREELALYTNHDQKRADIDGKFIINDSGQYVINFGNKKGALAEEEHGFLNWMLDKDFLPDTLEIAQSILYKDL